METRNPSPPPGFDSTVEEDDHIGNSAYSKRWLYSLILQVLTKLSQIGEIFDDIDEELDSLLEDDLCKLWDITSDQSLLEPLRQFQLVPVFTECIHKSKNHRLIEISLGILANISLDDEQCGVISEDPTFMANALGLLSTDDTRILIELFRLLRSVLASRPHRQVWLDAVHFAPEFIERVNFILVSSTNAHLLMSTINALETILRIDDSIGELWCNTNLLGSLQDAQHQMCWIHGDEVEIIYRIIYIFSTNSTGVRTLMSRVEDVFPNFGVLLRKICEDEPHLIPFYQYNSALRLILPVIDVIITNLSAKEALASFHFDKDTLPCLLQIILGCIQQNFVSGEITLDGLWEDLSGLFSDLIQRVHEYLQESPTSSELLQYSNDVLHCLTEIEEGNDEMRNAFVRCCLYRRVQVMTEREGEVSYNSNSSTVVEVLRGQLVFVCQRLHLSRLLECSTTNHN
ncbi:unnamed protein product [Hymenolepis diminuta]|uniref:Protein SAAL1 n=1 Tax=Hymenolepis diminuta TaxID=6216 RepID=A0A0R3SIL0_HYMDI|nr:unnamed protein product [Hymenolepis diminuta]VUZ45591.1 unnamed protein product [Hymenolepis diminuta]